MRSHSVTCHPAEVTFPPLPQPKLILDLATPEGCKAELTWDSIVHLLCVCVGVSGAEPTCQRLEYRDHYEDPATKCRTRVRVKHRRCQGSCGGTATGFCCLPRKIKTRRVSVHYSLHTLLCSIRHPQFWHRLTVLNVDSRRIHFKVSHCHLPPN